MSAKGSASKAVSLIVSTRDFFNNAIQEAMLNLHVNATPLAQGYLVEVLEKHVATDSLFDETDATGKRTRDTLAELYFKAQASEPRARIELLRRLGDRSLYISGFFADSLQRKVVDVDYYIDMGGTAYATIASEMAEELPSKVFKELATRFLEFADVFSHISTKSKLTDEANILRLYELYSKTGSNFVRQKLHDRGLIAVPMQKTGTDDDDKH